MSFLLAAAAVPQAAQAKKTGDAVQAGAAADQKAGIAVPGFLEARKIAEEGFIYGLPLVMNYAVMYKYCVDKNSGQYKTPFNILVNDHRLFTYEDTAIVTPNSDTPYSMAWLDLGAEPMVVTLPAVDKARYVALQLIDGNTFNFGYAGSRTTGNEGGDFLVAGPGWDGQVPPGIKQVFRSGTRFSLALLRTQLLSPGDMDNVVKVQSGYRARPLSAYLNQPAPKALPSLDFPHIDKELVKKNFFEYLDFALSLAPAGPEEKEIREKLARIGVGPGKSFEFKDLSLKHKLEIGLGMRAGEKKVDARAAALGKQVNGWRIASAFGGREFFKGDWLLRAAAAKAGIYGNDAAEAVYPMTRADASGKPLNGAKHAYEITFPAGQLPPVNAFWSVTMYDGLTQLLIENPIGRYLVNSPMLPDMRKNPDGSLTIYVQNAAPGPDKQANWLPAPHGPIYLVMRLYWPKTEPPSVLPPGEGSWQPPAVRRVK